MAAGGLAMGWRRLGLSEMLLSGLGKAISIQQAPVAGYVRRLRRARPEATPAEIVAVLEKRYVAVVTGTGAAVGSTAAVQAIGPVGMAADPR